MTDTLVRYHRHNCQRHHRDHLRFARCVWPRAAWIAGTGPFASVSACTHGRERRSYTTVALHGTVEEAQQALDDINATGCGGQCTRRHRLIELVIE